MEGNLLTAVDLSLSLRCSKGLIYKLIAEGEIPCVRIGHRFLRVRPEDLETYIRKHMTGGSFEPASRDTQISDRTKLGS